MAKKKIEKEKIKNKLIITVLKLIADKNNLETKKEAIEQLKIFSGFYNIYLTNKTKQKHNSIDLLNALIEFMQNGNGYLETIPNLYMILTNTKINHESTKIKAQTMATK